MAPDERRQRLASGADLHASMHKEEVQQTAAANNSCSFTGRDKKWIVSKSLLSPVQYDNI